MIWTPAGVIYKYLPTWPFVYTICPKRVTLLYEENDVGSCFKNVKRFFLSSPSPNSSWGIWGGDKLSSILIADVWGSCDNPSVTCDQAPKVEKHIYTLEYSSSQYLYLLLRVWCEKTDSFIIIVPFSYTLLTSNSITRSCNIRQLK